MSKTLYPGADTTTQNFQTRYPGSTMDTNCLLLHSTEGTGWPSYSGGATAPNMTIAPDFATKTVKVRQHFPANKSSRALENRSGGVETNTLNVFQIEMVGTCDPATHAKWGSTPHIYMPEAPDWFLAGVADVVKWLHAEYPKFQIEDGAPRGWGAYPASYGASKYRMTFTEWQNCYGIVGHEHAPEQSHGDPGAFPIGRLVALATGATPAPTPDPTPTPTSDRMNPAAYFLGAHGAHVTWLGTRLVAHGFDDAYTSGPGPTFTEADRLNVAAFQRAQGWTGADADGFPGAQSLTILAADPKVTIPAPKPPVVVLPAPKPKPAPTTLTVPTISLNCAAYDVKRGMANRLLRVKALAAVLIAKKPLWIHLQECSADMIAPMDHALVGYKRVSQGGRGRESWYRRDAGITILEAKLMNVSHMLLRDTKEFLLTAWSKGADTPAGEYRGLEVTFHSENQGVLVQKAQLFDVLTAAIAMADKHKIPYANILCTGDTNTKSWPSWLKGWNWKDGGTVATKRLNAGFASTNGWTGARKAGTRIDVDLVRHNATVTEYEQILTPVVSDHYPHYLVRKLV